MRLVHLLGRREGTYATRILFLLLIFYIVFLLVHFQNFKFQLKKLKTDILIISRLDVTLQHIHEQHQHTALNVSVQSGTKTIQSWSFRNKQFKPVRCGLSESGLSLSCVSVQGSQSDVRYHLMMSNKKYYLLIILWCRYRHHQIIMLNEINYAFNIFILIN